MLREILVDMRRLLVKHDSDQQESTLEVLQCIEASDEKAIAKALNSLEFWGGAGSICDLVLYDIPWTSEFRRDVPDDNKLTQLELELIDEMEKLGIAEARTTARKADIQWIAKQRGLV